MHEENENICCSLRGVTDVVGRKWALIIIDVVGNYRKVRFNTLMEELHGVSPKTLSDTLKKLQNEGLIRRESFAEIPPRVEYTLTEDGIELRKAVIPLLEWAVRRRAGAPA